MNTLEGLAAGFGSAMEPLVLGLSSPSQAEQLLSTLGWQLPPGVRDLGLSRLNAGALVEQVGDLRAALKFEAGNSTVNVGLSAELLVSVQAFVRSLNDLANNLGALLSADYLTRTRIREELPRRLLDHLLIRELQLNQPLVLTFFTLAGAIRFDRHEADPANFQLAHIRHTIAYDRFGAILTDTQGEIGRLVDWGSPAFNPGKLLTYFAFVLQALGGRGKLMPLARNVEERLSGRSIPEADAVPGTQLVMSLQRGFAFTGVDLGVSLLGLRPTVAGGADGGFAFSPFARGTTTLSFPLGPGVTLELDSSLDLGPGCAVIFRAAQPLKLQTGLIGSGAVGSTASGRIALRSRRKRPDGQPMSLLALPGGFRLELAEFTIAMGVDAKGGGLAPMVEFGLTGLHSHMEGLGSDGFLAKIVPSSLDTNFDLVIGWSGTGGLYFQGSSALEIQLASHVSFGPMELNALTLSIGTANGKFPVGIACDLKAPLGPLAAVVQGIGIEAGFSIVGDNSGNLGPLDLRPGLKLPKGVGLSLDAGIIKGGGFLFIDPDKGEYAGALELTFSEIVALKAIGIISTRLPDGSKGFSLLIIITAEFGTGIQLGFGFTLLAVGGLLGLNRTMRLDPLMQGIKTGAVNSIMFPRDVIANAPKIISDLRTIFPPEEGKFLIGPMAKLGWGTPTLISLSLGIIIEIPGNIAILGVLKAALPADKAAVLILQVNFAGAIEFDKSRMFFFAALFESRVLFAPLEGEMGVLMAFGADPNFVLTVGGFHPRFNPPPLPFSAPRRVSLELLNSPVASIRVEGYFGVTTNTAQFGARVELRYGVDEANVHGHLAFDALLQFSPFHFIVEISASFGAELFDIGLFSVSVRFALEGPTPWRARGSGSISLLFFDVSVDFDITWGEERDTSLPPITVMPLLKAEYDKESNWRAILPPASNLLVSLRKMRSDESAMVLHPVGVLRVTQKALPLELKLDKIGNQKPTDVNRLTVRVSTGGLAKTRDVSELFAPAQFQDMDDAQKLSQPAYGPQKAGLDLSAAGQQLASSRAVKRVVRYEQIVIDTNFKRFALRFIKYAGSLFHFFMGGASITKCELSQAKKVQLQPFAEKIAIRMDGYTVAFQSNNRAYSAEAMSLSSEASARDYMRQQIAKEPNLADSLHVIPEFERAA